MAKISDIFQQLLEETASPAAGGSAAQTSSYTPLGDYDAGTLYTQNAPDLSSDQAAYYQQQIQAAGDRYNSAATDAQRQAAHADAEYYRSLAGYSGGADGSDYIPLASASQPAAAAAGTFSYASAPEYVSRYQDQIDALAARLLNRSAFSYDPESDPAYQQYRSSYTRSGRLAMEDTLGQVAARTGGLASSYAGSAAQQAYDGYMGALADKVPELRALAYAMYRDEEDALRADLSTLQALESGDYSRYQDLLDQYNTDRSLAYTQYRDGVSDSRWQQSFDYDAGRDAELDRQWQDTFDYNQARDQASDARYDSTTSYSQALEKARTLAAAGDYSGYRALGYTQQEIAALAAAAAGGTEAAQGSAGPDYGGLYRGALAEERRGGSAQNYISTNYKRYGFTGSSGLYAAYQKWAQGVPAGELTALDYDEDEGVFTWGGTRYADSPGSPGSGLDSLLSALNAAYLTDEEWSQLLSRLERYGIQVGG